MLHSPCTAQAAAGGAQGTAEDLRVADSAAGAEAAELARISAASGGAAGAACHDFQRLLVPTLKRLRSLSRAVLYSARGAVLHQAVWHRIVLMSEHGAAQCYLSHNGKRSKAQYSPVYFQFSIAQSSPMLSLHPSQFHLRHFISRFLSCRASATLACLLSGPDSCRRGGLDRYLTCGSPSFGVGSASQGVSVVDFPEEGACAVVRACVRACALLHSSH